ncbi:MAG TPA: GNAT family N-acyltransferase [Alphaproteobacteria bacterium]
MQFDHITSEHLTLRLAADLHEIEAAQHLRYKVFYDEMGASPIHDMAALQRDYDHYDPFCDHLIVIDENASEGQKIVGTYRIFTDRKAKDANLPLYTETEFDISKMRAAGKNGKPGNIMEMSRSCILPDYRNKTVINLLWKGIAVYVFKNEIDYLIGVPSFNGLDIRQHEESLAYLNAFHRVDESICPTVLPEHYHALPVRDPESFDQKKAFNDLPPLIKGYLRIGCKIGDGYYIDEQFNMVDICIILEIDKVTDRYFSHYKRYDT